MKHKMSKIEIAIKNNKSWLHMQKTSAGLYRVGSVNCIYHDLYVKYSNDENILALPMMLRILHHDILSDGHIEDFIYGWAPTNRKKKKYGKENKTR